MVLGSSPEQVRHKLAVLQRHCDAVGRDVTSIDKSLLISTYLYDSEREFAQYLSDHARLLGAASQTGLLQARALGLAGSAAHVTETPGRYLACGFDYLILLFPYTREYDMLQRYAEEVWVHL